jgi:hypothetical protein
MPPKKTLLMTMASNQETLCTVGCDRNKAVQLSFIYFFASGEGVRRGGREKGWKGEREREEGEGC